MSQTATPGTRRGSSLVRFLNPVISRLLGAGLPFGPNVLLTVRGRSSGQPRTFPVAILRLDGRRYVQSPWGEVNWVRNLRAAGEAILSHGAQRERVDAVEIAPEQGGSILRGSMERYFRSRILSFAVRRFFGLGPHSTPDEFVAVAREHPMFELRVPAGT